MDAIHRTIEIPSTNELGPHVVRSINHRVAQFANNNRIKWSCRQSASQTIWPVVIEKQFSMLQEARFDPQTKLDLLDFVRSFGERIPSEDELEAHKLIAVVV